MSRMPGANECTVSVGKTTRRQQSEINEVDQHESEDMNGLKTSLLCQLFELVRVVAA